MGILRCIIFLERIRLQSHTQEITCQESGLALNYEIRDMEEYISCLNGQTNLENIQDVMDVLTRDKKVGRYMNKKYFFFDIDGTLTDRATGKIVPSAQVALNKLQEAGHFVAIATGRAHYKARNFMESVGLHDMVCCGGGGLVINDELIQNIPLDLNKSKAIAKQALSLGYGVLFALDDSIKVYTQDHTFQNQVGDRKEPTEYIYDENLDVDALDVIYKMYISIPKEKESELTLKDTLGNMRFVPDYLMFQYDAKHQGILDMMQHVGGDLKDVVVFGDDTNDMVMFDPQWTSVAMGNACQELKNIATLVTDANVDDGIYNICKKMEWI